VHDLPDARRLGRRYQIGGVPRLLPLIAGVGPHLHGENPRCPLRRLGQACQVIERGFEQLDILGRQGQGRFAVFIAHNGSYHDIAFRY